MYEKKIYFAFAAVIILISALVIYQTYTTDPFYELISSEQNVSSSTNRGSSIPKARNLPTMKIADTEIYIEIANDNSSRARGLSGRESIPEDQGMLFLYDVETMPGFWMYDMRFDLDMIWINNAKVVDITENVPAPTADTPDSELPKYYPTQTVNAILEVNAGFVEKNNIQIGDTVVFPDEINN